MRVDLASLSVGDNNRTRWVDGHVESVAASMGELGQLSPILVRRHGDGWRVVAGETRVKAARALGWADIEATLLEVEGLDALAVTVAENECRANVDPVDAADGLARFQAAGESAAKIAKRVGLSAGRVADLLRVAGLCEDLRHLVRFGGLSVSRAAACADLDTDRQRVAAAASAQGLDGPAWSALCDRLRQEQGTESMFAGADFELAVETYVSAAETAADAVRGRRALARAVESVDDATAAKIAALLAGESQETPRGVKVDPEKADTWGQGSQRRRTALAKAIALVQSLQ